jgi:three-Cys-motif partner protein
MSKTIGTIWALEPHTAKKHEILRRYFQAWLPIMVKWNSRVLFIDGFAGPGEYSKGEDGSPVIVLKAARDHTHKFEAELVCLFVDADRSRYEHLNGVLAKIKPTLPPNIKFQTVHGVFNEHVTQVCKGLEEQKKLLAPTLAFVDPFGYSHTPFTTIAKLMGYQKCETLINFMFEEVVRFLPVPNQAQHFDALFGTTKWRETLKLSTPDERLRFTHDLYLNQLRKVAQYVRSFQMVNMGNRVDYFLFFATNNLKGLEKMKEAMWKADPRGEFQFSDYTDASKQSNLFPDEPDYDALRKLIVGRFIGKQVAIEELGDWVVAETPFLRTHIKKPILIPMEAEGALSVLKPKAGRRKGTFPDGTMLKFR